MILKNKPTSTNWKLPIGIGIAFALFFSIVQFIASYSQHDSLLARVIGSLSGGIIGGVAAVLIFHFRSINTIRQFQTIATYRVKRNSRYNAMIRSGKLPEDKRELTDLLTYIHDLEKRNDYASKMYARYPFGKIGARIIIIIMGISVGLSSFHWGAVVFAAVLVIGIVGEIQLKKFTKNTELIYAKVEKKHS